MFAAGAAVRGVALPLHVVVAVAGKGYAAGTAPRVALAVAASPPRTVLEVVVVAGWVTDTAPRIAVAARRAAPPPCAVLVVVVVVIAGWLAGTV
jgi:hypothetical protein